MDKTKILIIMNLFISAIAMGLYAFTMYQDNQIGYSFTFVILGCFFIVFAIYGMIRNHKLAQTKETH
ncbi:hypothetical protein [Pseudalkalibacillus hwajinpoensis]|uniref:hypothetical protein n=1 Tax=Guptibacillus hwajinpoensis TaxID=208199 RepID=UPI001CFED1EA|nr:hypothetical protein [Pseudalkalibacillus hwajinpoensis]